MKLYHHPLSGHSHRARLFASLLRVREWLVGERPTIADIAIYSYVARASEGNVDLSGYPDVTAFLHRIEVLPDFVPFVETPVGLSAVA